MALARGPSTTLAPATRPGPHSIRGTPMHAVLSWTRSVVGAAPVIAVRGGGPARCCARSSLDTHYCCCRQRRAQQQAAHGPPPRRAGGRQAGPRPTHISRNGI